jgi:hypothetical protein
MYIFWRYVLWIYSRNLFHFSWLSWSRRYNLTSDKFHCIIRRCLLLLNLLGWATRILPWRDCRLLTRYSWISSNYLYLFVTIILVIFEIIIRDIILRHISLILLLRFIRSIWSCFSKSNWIIIILQLSLYLWRTLLWRSINWLMKLLGCIPLTIVWTVPSIFSTNWLFQITISWLYWYLLKPVWSFIWFNFIDCLFIMVIIRHIKCALIIYLLTMWVLL